MMCDEFCSNLSVPAMDTYRDCKRNTCLSCPHEPTCPIDIEQLADAAFREVNDLIRELACMAATYASENGHAANPDEWIGEARRRCFPEEAP
jgi:histone acetyltransferase (RNA polymerase elongator complex component)